MPDILTQPVYVVDVGNTRVKCAKLSFPLGATHPPSVLAMAVSENAQPHFQSFHALLTPREEMAATGPESPHPTTHNWYMGSVCRSAETPFLEWLTKHSPSDHVVHLTHKDLPIQVRTLQPHKTGIDRVAAAAAACVMRRAGHPAAIVDVGTFIKVDLVSGDGAFLGGAILPGPLISARGMHDFAERLPLIDHTDVLGPSELGKVLQAPPALGQDTRSAMKSGLFWGAVGAIRQLLRQLQHERCGGAPLQVFCTGGGAEGLLPHLPEPCSYHPHLVLHGLALASKRPAGPA